MKKTQKMKKKKNATLICKRLNGNSLRCNIVCSENNLQLCEKHFNLQKEFLAKNPSLITKERSQLFGIDTPFLTKMNKEKEEKDLPPDEQRCCRSDGIKWRCKNFRMCFDPQQDDSDVPDTKYCRQHRLDRQEKMKRRGDGEGAGAPDCTTNCSNKRRKTKAVAEDEDHQLPATTSDISDSDKIIEGDSPNIGTKRKNLNGVLESLTRTRDPEVELESLEHYKGECIKLAVELEKKKLECTTLQGKLAEVDIRITAVKDDSKRTLADLENRVLRMEKEKSTMGCLESRILNLENIVLRMDNENSSAAGCVESRISKLEILNLRLEDENLTRAGCVESCLLNLESLVLRRKKRFVNMVSDDSGESSGESLNEDCNNSVDSKTSLGDLVLKLAVNNWNRNRDKELKWKFEADMLSSFEENPELCMKAVCALYRQQISEDDMSTKGLFHYSDALRVTTLAKFLMAEDGKGDLKKSVEDLEIFDSEAIENCKMLARRYSKQLFGIYQNRKDPYFLPSISASHGDPTVK